MAIRKSLECGHTLFFSGYQNTNDRQLCAGFFSLDRLTERRPHRDIHIDDGLTDLYGFANIDWPAGFSTTSFDCTISDALQGERYNLDGLLRDGHLTGRLDAFKLKLERLRIPNLDGYVNAVVKLSWRSIKDYFSGN
jgi:hypothetical protein